jgi:DNA-directed RNA polymerase subunit RPC12/RpoP
MTIRFACLSCGKKLHTEDKNRGRSTQCPACGSAVTVPAASTRPDRHHLSGPKIARSGSTRRKKAGVSRKDLQRAREFYETAEGTSLERYCIAGLMLAIESEEIAAQRRALTPDRDMIFMTTYECCVMWAIKRGLESEVDAQGVQSAVRAMQRHLAKQAWYEATAFKRIWAAMERMMPMAMTVKRQPMDAQLTGQDMLGNTIMARP